MSKGKDIRLVVRQLREQGFYVDESGKHNYANNFARYDAGDPDIVPRGRNSMGFAKTPRNDTGVNNAIARLRRELGFKWQGR